MSPNWFHHLLKKLIQKLGGPVPLHTPPMHSLASGYAKQEVCLALERLESRIVPATLTPATNPLPATATSLVIQGTGIDPILAGDEAISFSSSSAGTPNGVTGSAIAATSTSLTVSLTGLSTLPPGATLYANAIIDNANTNGGAFEAVAIIAPADPSLTPSSAALPGNATTLTIAGGDFDTTASNDIVAFSNSVTGSVTTATSTALTLSVTGVNNVTAGTPLYASVMVDGASAGNPVEVGLVVPAITPNSASLSLTSSVLTIMGGGFDVTATHDIVTFSSDVTGTVSNATSTSLTITNLTGLTPGVIVDASVTVDSVSSGVPVEVGAVALVVTSTGDSGSTPGTLPWAIANDPVGGIITFADSLYSSGTITSGTWAISPGSGAAETATFASLFPVGAAEIITVSGVAPTAYDGTWTVASVNSDGFTVVIPVNNPYSQTNTSPGDTTCGGTITDPGIITVSQTLTLAHAVTIQGPGTAKLFVSGGGVVGVFSVSSGVTATIANLTITNGGESSSGNPEGSGGGVYNAGTLTLNNILLSADSAGNGGAIFNATGGTLTLTASTLCYDSAGQGGAIFSNGFGSLTLANDTLSDNSGSSGGGIYLNADDVLNLSNSVLMRCDSNQPDGAITDKGGQVTATSTTFSNNLDLQGSGAITVNTGSSPINGPGATAYTTSGGGTAYSYLGTITLANSLLTHNTGVYGGALAVASNCSTTVSYSTFFR